MSTPKPKFTPKPRYWTDAQVAARLNMSVSYFSEHKLRLYRAGMPQPDELFGGKTDAKALDHAGLKGLSFHGLRVTAAVMLAEAGCTETEIQSILGHRTVAMSAYYRRQADRQKNAESAILKLERKQAEV